MKRISVDVVVVGAGHNGLVAATLLARRGLSVLVLEEKPVIGGAARTERPFAKARNLRTSTGSYLLGLMPPELLGKLGARLELIRRDPHYFLPTLDGRYLLFGSDRAATREQFIRFFSEADWNASEALNAEVDQLRSDLAPAWLEEPLSAEATAERYIRPELRQVFVDLAKQPVEDYLRRFDFKSELVLAMYAVTDGFSGVTAGFGTPGTALNFLVHNMCRLPGSDGTFMIVRGGMGAVSAEFARLAREAGASIRTDAAVSRIAMSGGRTTGVVLSNGEEIDARVVVSNADPFRMRQLVGAEAFPAEFNSKLDGLVRKGTTMKVNLALDRLPTFKCLPENRGQHNATIHLLPDGPDVLGQLRRGFEAVAQGRLADFPTIEWYFHTQADPSLKDAEGRHNSAFFVQSVPYELSERDGDAYAKHLCGIAEQFAPGFTSSVVDTFVLTPQKIEQHFGITWGHIQHVDNTIGFDQRMPYRTPVDGLYSCSAGCHPAGAVNGAAGHNAANRIARDLGLAG